MKFCLLQIVVFTTIAYGLSAQTVIRYNQLGYTPGSPKVLVAGSKDASFQLQNYHVLNLETGNIVLLHDTPQERDFGSYGPFLHSFRIDISSIQEKGIYQLFINDSIRSGVIRIGDNVYNGSADFCLRYMRQQRCGFNPFLGDSCHTRDGYSIYGSEAGLPDGTHIDATGGWHDASDYLQYATTSANAAYHLLMAWRDHPYAFADTRQANGLEGINGMPDVLDEAKWGLDWLLRMHPTDNWMFAQLADDRDHISMRMPGLDSQYGKGFERPLYFLTGEPQGLGKYKNKTEGTTSVAAKFSSAFALGYRIFEEFHNYRNYSEILRKKVFTAKTFAFLRKGFTNTAPNRAPYYYAEENWADDAELMEAALFSMDAESKQTQNRLANSALAFARQEPQTPWLGADTASHYQWYPFINIGHRELASALPPSDNRDLLIKYYKAGIEKVMVKAKSNAFLRGVPFIWCSNNLTVAFAMQCLWYRQLSSDNQFHELEQANIDWLFGTNPWGTSMVYGLPGWGDTPVDPHSAFTHLKSYPIDGGLVDGPVYTSIFKGLIGLTLYQPDEYESWQSDLAVYHDDYGDYSTNEPTMDGTASLIYLLSALEAPEKANQKHKGPSSSIVIPTNTTVSHGAIIRGDSAISNLALVFTGHQFAEGGDSILSTLEQHGLKAAFFFTGDFVRQYPGLVQQLVKAGHYVGAHSNKHLLYCDWQNRDSLLVSKEAFQQDLLDNYKALASFGITVEKSPWFLPPYEWYNSTIASWCSELGITLINNTPGTLSAADYTTLKDINFRDNQTIYQSILEKANQPGGLNGHLLLTHIGAGPERPDGFYKLLPSLIERLRKAGHNIVPLQKLLGP